MAIGLAFWIIMLVWFLFGLASNWPGGGVTVSPYFGIAHSLLLFVLFALLGFHAFGAALHG